MKVVNIKRRLEKLGATDITIKAELVAWGGYNIVMTANIGNYYDLRILEQMHNTNSSMTEAEAIELFLAKDIDYYCTKPWHDEDDPRSDYHAYAIHYRISDIDWRVKNLADIPANAFRGK